jgi:IS5 family transposase
MLSTIWFITYHGTADNVVAVTEVAELLHGEDNAVYANAEYTGVEKLEEREHQKVIRKIAACNIMYSEFNKRNVLYKAKRKYRRVGRLT